MYDFLQWTRTDILANVNPAVAELIYDHGYVAAYPRINEWMEQKYLKLPLPGTWRLNGAQGNFEVFTYLSMEDLRHEDPYPGDRGSQVYADYLDWLKAHKPPCPIVAIRNLPTGKIAIGGDRRAYHAARELGFTQIAAWFEEARRDDPHCWQVKRLGREHHRTAAIVGPGALED